MAHVADDEDRVGVFHLILWVAGGLEVGHFRPRVIFLVYSTGGCTFLS